MLLGDCFAESLGFLFLLWHPVFEQHIRDKWTSEVSAVHFIRVTRINKYNFTCCLMTVLMKILRLQL